MRIGERKLVLMVALALAVWVGAAAATSHAAQILTIGEHAALPAGGVRVPVQMADATGVAATAFIVNFDPDLLALANVTTGGLGAAFALEYKLEEGRVAVALVRDEALTAGAGTLVYLHFTMNGGAVAGMTAPLALADGTASGQHAVDLAWSQGVAHSNGVVRVVSLAQDSDVDGLPDWWEERYFEGPTRANTALDSDGDGMTNGQECLAGTNPTNRSSLLRFEHIARAADGTGIVLSWQSVDGKFYRLERGTNLADVPAFGTLVRTNIPGTAPMNTETDKTPVGEGPWFYRIKLE
jgi:hypothetical protein